MASQRETEIIERPVTQEEIARKAGVSRSIVSRVLSNAPDSNISPATRNRIVEISKQLNYRPKTSIQRHHNIVVGLYDLDYINRPFFATIITGVARQSAVFDFDLQFLSMNPEIGVTEPDLYFLNRPRNRNVKGYIIIDQAVPDADILRLHEKGFPLVMIDREIEGADLPCVLSNEEKVLYDLTSYLLNKGRRNVAIVIASREWNREARKLRGFKAALADHGLQFDEDLVFDTAYKEGIELTNLLLSILNRRDRPNAVITGRDDLAVQLIELAMDLGLNVPGDIAITGYNDTEIASVYPVAITSVRVPLREMGERAIVLLENLIEEKPVEEHRLLLNPKIIVRESC